MAEKIIDFKKRFTDDRRRDFAEMLIEMSYRIGFKVSSRGWCYLMEQAGYINKSQFDKVDENINECRKKGYLPVDFVAEEDARAFSGVEKPSEGHLGDTLQWMLEDVLDGGKYFKPDWWAGENYYIQVLVEKIDLKTLFEPVCEKYKIPIANAKGWSSILQRAEYCRRYQEAEENGLKCVLLYCGDHDPDGLRIADTIRTNLEQISAVEWSDGKRGYDPSNLIIDRIGLKYDFIVANKYTWIDNLITGSGKNLADRNHPNYNLPYLQRYLKTIGVRKCEANAIVTTPRAARELITGSIEYYLGKDAEKRFEKKREIVNKQYKNLLSQTGLAEPIQEFLNGDKKIDWGKLNDGIDD